MASSRRKLSIKRLNLEKTLKPFSIKLLQGLIALVWLWLGLSQPALAQTHVLQLNDVSLEVDADHGARITAFRLKGENVLSSASVNAQNYGSTFWPSPQRLWNWPPLVAIDSEPYTIIPNNLQSNPQSPNQPEVLNSQPSLVMESPVCSELSIQVSKKFSLDVERSGFSVEYTIKNISDKAQALAPWEISRVPAGGLTFYPTGEAYLGSGPFENLATQEVGGVTWFKYDSETLQANQKLYADGAEGWLAHIDGNQLLIKSFPDIPLNKQAPAEGEIEIFANASSPYVEIEEQGSYTTLAPQASLSWQVDWFLRELPVSISPEVGNQQLVDYVREIIAS